MEAIGFPRWGSWGPGDGSGTPERGVSLWFLFLEEHVASQRLNVIREPEEPNICKHFLNAGTQLARGNLSGVESLSEILNMEGCSVAKTGLSQFC